MTFVAALAVLLVGYNSATNLLGLPEPLYVPVNLAAAGLLVGVARRRRHSWEELGLAAAAVRRGVCWGAAGALAVAAVLVLAIVVPAAAPLLADARIADLGPRELLFLMLVRVPLGTVVLEEVAFRGVLLGAWARHGSTAAAVVGSSAVFGLWHVGPMVRLLADNEVALDAARFALAVGAGVALTALGGIAFALLRLRSGSLVAPAVVHSATNSLGALAAALSQAG